MFRIASFAELAGVSPKMLRDYDRRGIFRPAWVDPESGYRSYSPAQLPDIRRLLALRDLGVGLDELERLVSERADLRETLDRRRVALEAARREIERRLASLGIALAEDGSGMAGLDVVVRTLRPERVATLEVARVPGMDVGRAFYELERRVRDAGARAAKPPGMLLDRQRSGAMEVFVPVRHPAPSFVSRSLPACRAATILRRGPYAASRQAWRDLDGWIRDAGLTAAGPARILYLQFGAEVDLRLPERFLVREDVDYLTELQVPVE